MSDLEGRPPEVRRATPTDVDGLVLVYMDSARYHATRVDPYVFGAPDPGAVRSAFEVKTRATDLSLLVVEERGAVVGFVEVEILDTATPDDLHRARRYGWVEELAVAEDERGKGVGAALLTAAEAWARDRGADAMLLDSHPNNGAALRFYRDRMGYSPTGIRLIKRLDGSAKA